MRYVAFLRGMNLGRRRISNDALRRHVEALGFDGVTTYRASGNVMFDGAPTTDATAVLEAGLAERLGYPVQTFVRSLDELARTLAHDPFSKRERATMGKAQITFLRDAPSPEVVAAVCALATSEDRLDVYERAWYWLPREGISTAALELAAVERLVGVGTTRTEGTCAAILDKLRAS